MAAARKKPGRGAAKPSAAEEAEQKVFDALAGLLRSLGHDVHVSKTLDGRGGDCLVNGAKRVIVSRRLPLSERVDVLVEVLRRQDLTGADVPADLAEILQGAPRAAS